MASEYKIVDIDDFLQLEDMRLTDVRSPGEFAIGHIPGAVNLPLFSDAERAAVGLSYKTEGPYEAMLKGLDLVGPKMSALVQNAYELTAFKKMAMYCWRGGKRSQSMAWLLNNAGFEIVVLKGGYKSYRNYIHSCFENLSLDILILGGKTGNAKTEILSLLQKFGEPVVDLEALARHKGSAFGSIGESSQLYNEQFENNLFVKLKEIEKKYSYVWLENESRTIGRNYIPDALWLKMKNSTLININRNLECRIQHLLKCYNRDNSEELISSFKKIEKRLGFEMTEKAIGFVREGLLDEAAILALNYYDKCYEYNLYTNKSPHIVHFDFANDSVEQITLKLIENKEMYNNGRSRED